MGEKFDVRATEDAAPAASRARDGAREPTFRDAHRRRDRFERARGRRFDRVNIVAREARESTARGGRARARRRRFRETPWLPRGTSAR